MKEFNEGTLKIEGVDETYEGTSDEEEMQPEEEYEEEDDEVPYAANAIPQTGLKSKLKTWYQKHQLSRECVEDLLKILKSENIDVPASVEGLIGIRKASPEICRDVEQNGAAFSEILRSLERIENTQRKMNNKLCKLQSVVDQLVSKNDPINKKNLFPISSLEDLEYAESVISQDIAKYINILKLIIQPEGLCKNLCRVFSSNMILDMNYDGVGNKIAFTKYKYLKEAIMESTAAEDRTEKDFIKEMRDCLRTYKKRIFKKNYDDRNRKRVTDH